MRRCSLRSFTCHMLAHFLTLSVAGDFNCAGAELLFQQEPQKRKLVFLFVISLFFICCFARSTVACFFLSFFTPVSFLLFSAPGTATSPQGCAHLLGTEQSKRRRVGHFICTAQSTRWGPPTPRSVYLLCQPALLAGKVSRGYGGMLSRSSACWTFHPTWSKRSR